jgi:phosphoglycolate phosphatase-like HAD superfamily hydrolase
VPSSDPPPEKRTDPPASPEGASLPMVGGATSHLTEIERPPMEEPFVEPTQVARGVVVFDLDGTILDDISLISHVAADAIHKAFGTPEAEARIHYLATTGMPFEAQLAQLYPSVPAADRSALARRFHERKVREAYAHAAPFPDVPKLIKRLSSDGWTLVISTGAEREMADLVLEREGLRFWFEAVLGSAQGTKREHLVEYRRRYPGVPVVMVGDSRFDMEAAGSIGGVTAVARASSLQGWMLTPADLRRWGAQWADYSLSELPEWIDRLAPQRPAPRRATPARRRGARKGRDRESPGAGGGPASV